MSDSNTPTQEQITRRAYEIFIERGSPEGRDLEHWLEAEKQLRAAGQSKSATPVTASANSTPNPTAAAAATSNGRSAGNGKTTSTRAAARK